MAYPSTISVTFSLLPRPSISHFANGHFNLQPPRRHPTASPARRWPEPGEEFGLAAAAAAATADAASGRSSRITALRSVEDIFSDFRARRSAIVRALTEGRWTPRLIEPQPETWNPSWTGA